MREVQVNSDAPHVTPVASVKSSEFVNEFKNGLKIEIQSMNDEQIVFDLIGADASIANALRRILISEVPTMAIETLYILNNSSIIQDEVLAHRVGLIPLNVDPREFLCFEDEEDVATDTNTIVYKLDVTCSFDPDFPDDVSKALHSNVYARDLEWMPQGNQEEKFGNIRPIHEDILIAKLRPGQSIAFEAHCRKSIGQDHAKFSPVSTASYRLMPSIHLSENILKEEAQNLVDLCPMKVFDIEDMQAVVARPRDCTMCRECIREDPFRQKVSLTRRFDHFVFSVESVGMLPAAVLVQEALRILIEKCDIAKEAVSTFTA